MIPVKSAPVKQKKEQVSLRINRLRIPITSPQRNKCNGACGRWRLGAFKLTGFAATSQVSKRLSKRWTFFSTRSSRWSQVSKGIQGLKFSTWNQSSTSMVSKMCFFVITDRNGSIFIYLLDRIYRIFRIFFVYLYQFPGETDKISKV